MTFDFDFNKLLDHIVHCYKNDSTIIYTHHNRSEKQEFCFMMTANSRVFWDYSTTQRVKNNTTHARR